MECMELKICMSDKHHRYYKHTKFRQNPRGDPKFLVDLTRNDPYIFVWCDEATLYTVLCVGEKKWFGQGDQLHLHILH